MLAPYTQKPNWTKTKAVKLLASNLTSPIELSTYSDGEILFWSPDNNVTFSLPFKSVEQLRNALNSMGDPILGTPIEHNNLKSNTYNLLDLVTITSDLKNLKELINDTTSIDKVNKEIIRATNNPEYICAKPKDTKPKDTKPKDTKPKDTKPKDTKLKVINSISFDRKISKEDNGWGVFVNIRNNPYRYYYKTRDAARSALASHNVGEHGRLL